MHKEYFIACINCILFIHSSLVGHWHWLQWIMLHWAALQFLRSSFCVGGTEVFIEWQPAFPRHLLWARLCSVGTQWWANLTEASRPPSWGSSIVMFTFGPVVREQSRENSNLWVTQTWPVPGIPVPTGVGIYICYLIWQAFLRVL